MKENQIKIIILSCIVSLGISCQSDPFRVNTEGIEPNIILRNFAQDFMNLAEVAHHDSQFLEAYTQLKESYPYFLYDWLLMPEMMDIGHPNDPETPLILREMLKSKPLLELYSNILSRFGDFSEFKSELTQAYKRFLYYLPHQSIPEVIPFIGNFSLTMNPVGKNYIGVSLEMNMDDTFRYYKLLNPPIEQYFYKLFTHENMAPLHIQAHANDLYNHTHAAVKFSDYLLYWGKLLYFTEAMMPNKPKHLIIGYTPQEWKQCIQEEKEIWTYFIKEDLLYSSDSRVYMRHFSEGPYTVAPGVPEQTPPMLGKFAGWRMVSHYMKKNPEVTLAELMELSDSELFLQQAKYKP